MTWLKYWENTYQEDTIVAVINGHHEPGILHERLLQIVYGHHEDRAAGGQNTLREKAIERYTGAWHHASATLDRLSLSDAVTS